MIGLFGLRVIESESAVEQDGTEDREIQIERGGFWERLFDPDPTLPLWQKTKTKIVKLPRYKPVMYRIMDKLIIHPSLMPSLMEAIKESQKPNRIYRYE